MKRNKFRTYALWGILVAGVAVLTMAVFWQGLTVRLYTETSGKIGSSVRIAVLTDFHDSNYGEKQQKLIKAIRIQEPDLILLVGDIADEIRPHDATKELLSAIGSLFPCYYVTGNHEYRSGEAADIKELIRSCGVTVLEADAEIIRVSGQEIRLCGVDDPLAFRSPYNTDHDVTESWQTQFEACRAEAGDGIYTILLSHRPELTEPYRDSGFDLVLAGHAHGGQIRIPGLINGLFAPNQGLFPSYAGGRYTLGETVMIVSRGLCRNAIPRVFNPPELVIVDLEPET